MKTKHKVETPDFKLHNGCTQSNFIGDGFIGDGIPDIGQFTPADLKILKALIHKGIMKTYRAPWCPDWTIITTLKTWYYIPSL